jgi:hypothetical protein
MSNWETRELTLQQIQYAATDAWLSYTILITLLEQPTIHAVSMPVDPSDAQVFSMAIPPWLMMLQFYPIYLSCSSTTIIQSHGFQ